MQVRHVALSHTFIALNEYFRYFSTCLWQLENSRVVISCVRTHTYVCRFVIVCATDASVFSTLKRMSKAFATMEITLYVAMKILTYLLWNTRVKHYTLSKKKKKFAINCKKKKNNTLVLMRITKNCAKL